MEQQIQMIAKRLDVIEQILKGSKKVMTLNEFCQYTGYSKNYVYKLTSRNEVPHFKRGKKVFFDKDIIDEWLKMNPITDVETKAKALANI